ncbi:MAG: hypothetical protein ABIA93_02665 [Candidatus Woesearchaeota archaeon]
MKQELKRIDVLKTGLLCALGMMSILVVAFIAIILLGLTLGFAGQNYGYWIALGVLIAGILYIILYGIMGFVSGIIGAWLYNVFAKWVVGIKIDLETTK